MKFASWLSYFEQTSDFLDLIQIKKRKDLFAIDAVMNLTYNIKLSLKERKNTTCVFLDIKKAYDYVLKWWFWNNQKEKEHFFEDVNSMY